MENQEDKMERKMVTVEMPQDAAIAASQLLCDIRLGQVKLNLSNETLNRLADAEFAMVKTIRGG